ncbi:MAG: agmatine deiminase family protein [Bacteroidia bacterium]|nr:agmatine deiminase family protein [Bacteroidia bacterium]
MWREIPSDQFDFQGYRMPAEWEPQDATWLAWPDNPDTWPEHLDQTRGVYVQMITALCRFQKVNLLVKGCAADDGVEARLAGKSFNRANLRIIHIPYNDSWMRDAGPIFVTKPGAPDPLLAHDFVFNAWGAKYEPYQDDDDIPVHASRLLQVPVVRHNLVLEGGSIDVNGKGTLLTTRQCLLHPNRNPGLTREEIESRLKRFLGLTTILWLDEGIEGDDTDGHIDDITRFVSPTRVMTVVENNRSDANHAPLAGNLRKLRELRDQDGQPLEIIELPMPDKHLEGPFGRSPASYANFLIANGCVLVPVYSAPNEALALSLFRDAFPDREIIPIECTPLVAGLGSIHCVTQQQPRP